MTYDALKAKGFHQAPDGSYSKPARRDLAQLGCAERERDPAPPLDGGRAPRKNCPCGVGICIEIISFRKRLLDDDNNEGGNKNLRDAVAATLGLDDGDPAIRWDYTQVLTKGATGTLVKVTIYQSQP